MWHGTLQGNEDPGTWAFEEAIATGWSLLPSPQSKQQQPILAGSRAWLHRWEVPPGSGGEPVTQEQRSTWASRLGLRLPVNHYKIMESMSTLPKLYIEETLFFRVFISTWSLLCRIKHTSCIPAFLLLSFSVCYQEAAARNCAIHEGRCFTPQHNQERGKWRLIEASVGCGYNAHGYSVYLEWTGSLLSTINTKEWVLVAGSQPRGRIPN